MLSAATVELLRGHPLLADHAVSLGYVERLLKLLSARLPSKPQGKLLRTSRYNNNNINNHNHNIKKSKKININIINIIKAFQLT